MYSSLQLLFNVESKYIKPGLVRNILGERLLSL